jgi:hypothetical protein
MEFRLFSKIDHALGPEQLHQPLARDDFTGMRQQFEQHAQRLLRQSLRLAVAHQLAGVRTHRPIVEFNLSRVSHLSEARGK